MKEKLKLVIMLLCVLAVCSCTTVNLESGLTDRLVSMTPVPGNIEHNIVGRFSEELRVFYTINGLVPTSRLEMDEVINKNIEKYHGDGVVNLSINDSFSGFDILIQLGLGAGGYLVGYMLAGAPNTAPAMGSIGASVAQFFVQSRTVTISGDVFQLN